MKWSIKKLLKNSNANQLDFFTMISITEQQNRLLLTLRKEIRQELRNGFSLIRHSMSKVGDNWHLKNEDINEQLSVDITEKIKKLSPVAKSALAVITPRFKTQGSFVYKTLNNPAHLPPQEIDLDDGVYLPMQIFEKSPIISKNLFFDIVDTILRKLAHKNRWTYVDTKDTCGRLLVGQNVHIDIPLYAIPMDKFLAISESKSLTAHSIKFEDASSRLNRDDVHLAVRSSEGWRKSDPATVHSWFLEQVSIHGEGLRQVSRYLKAWKDNQFKTGGPSSITLMACAVDVYNNQVTPFADDNAALLACCLQLPLLLKEGVESPDPSDNDKLFPRNGANAEETDRIVNFAAQLATKMSDALTVLESKQDVHNKLIDIFGSRVAKCHCNLIESAKYNAVMSEPAEPQPQAEAENMTSG
jgi:hypothetical protein